MGDIDELTASQPLAVGRGMVARRGRHLQYLTISWNSAECLVALAAGFVAGSIALVGFGFDSAIEVTYDAIAALVTRRAPDTSPIGIVLAALSLIVMPILVRFKRRVARELQSGALEAEARQTRVCAYLSAILVVGLGLNAAFGWWWADPVAALGMAPLIAREGLDAVRGRTCCD